MANCRLRMPEDLQQHLTNRVQRLDRAGLGVWLDALEKLRAPQSATCCTTGLGVSGLQLRCYWKASAE